MQAVIFDMDGLLIDSEPFWKQAESDVFSSVGVEITADLATLTAAMTTREVTEFWYAKQPWQNASLEEVENRVVERVKYLIETQGQAMHGVHDLLESLQQAKVKIGLATNSPKDIIPSVLQRLNNATRPEIAIEARLSVDDVSESDRLDKWIQYKTGPSVQQVSLERPRAPYSTTVSYHHKVPLN